MLDHQRWSAEMELFRYCYQLHVTEFGARYERRALPTEGGVQDQPAGTMAMLDLIERVTNEQLAEMVKRGRPGSHDTDQR